MKPIRILHMIGSLEMGGSQAMVINLYKAIDREQIQFDFIVDHPERMALASVIKSMGAKIYFMPTFTGKNYFQVRKAWNTFFPEHPEYKILHSHVRSYASLYIPIAKKHGLKTIIHSHSTSNGKGVASIVKRVLQYPLRYQADYLIACSNEAGRWLYGKKACLKQNYIFMPNAIDAERYRYSEETAKTYRKEMGLEGKFVVGHVGRFHKAKNHMFLLDIFADICARRTDAVLMLVGDGDLRSAIEEKIHALNLEDRVILTGNRSDVPELMQAMDTFVFPSVWEGLGIVAVEAQAAGLPCICSNQVPSKAKVTDNCVFLPFEKELWVKTVLDMPINRTDTYKEIVTGGYDVHVTAQWLLEFYQNIWRVTNEVFA